MKKNNFFILGKFTKCNRKTGELKLIVDATDPGAYAPTEVLFLDIDGGLVPFFIDTIRARDHESYSVLLKDYDHPEKAERLANSTVFLQRSGEADQADDQFGFDEIVGFKVIDKTHGHIGTVETVIEGTQQNILQIRHQGIEILVPIAEEIIRKVRRKQNELLISAPDGLIELYLGNEKAQMDTLPKFEFKQFSISHHRATIKVGTDAIILGARANIKNCNRILEVGTGCGIIALMLAQRCKAKIIAIDIDKDSATESSENFSNSPWTKRMSMVHQSLAAFAESPQKKFDLIVSNPPFFTNSLLPDSDKYKKAKHNTSLSLENLAKYSAVLMEKEARLVIIIPASEEQKMIFACRENGLNLADRCEIFPKKTKSSRRVILDFYNSQPANVTSSQLAIRNDNGKFTDEYKHLTAAFHPDAYFE